MRLLKQDEVVVNLSDEGLSLEAEKGDIADITETNLRRPLATVAGGAAQPLSSPPRVLKRRIVGGVLGGA